MDEASGMSASATSAAQRTDVEKLHELGYAQELKRGMGAFSNFAVSFTIISILSGCLTLFGFGMFTGGPASSAYGWPLVGILVTFVALAMAEICSSYPTAGGLYYWSAKVAPRNGPAWSWFTGWFNLVGQVGITAGIDFGLAFFINAYLNLAFGLSTARSNTIIIFGVVLFLHGLLNTFGVRLVAILNDVSVWWHILGVLIIVGAMFLSAPSGHFTVGEVFSTFHNGTGWSSKIYVFLIGLLLAQYTFTGYDASAHMTEETQRADVAGPRGIVMSIVVSLFAGWILLIGVTYAISPGTYDKVLSSAFAGTGVPPVEIWVSATTRKIAEFLLFITVGAQF